MLKVSEKERHESHEIRMGIYQLTKKGVYETSSTLFHWLLQTFLPFETLEAWSPFSQ